ncbi:MAG: PAP2 family protein [Planctomycetota bacterium]|nr:MAG: PAP2 family protein [Planctomycetota bacterium]REK27316.1 MAG: PAP2 family protein [Planctomycetota bacterium]REK36663.1 MAG: PAP2 family protein [Planctomycetota bacterium]
MRIFDSWQPRVIASLLVLTVFCWTFIELADYATDGPPHGIDLKLLKSFRDEEDLSRLRGPAWFGGVVRDITALGGYSVLALTTLAVTGFLALSGRPREARFVLTAVVGGWVLAYGLKFAFDRPRPDVVPHLYDVKSSSFPSGHSLMSAVVYLTLGSLLSNLVERDRLKVYLLTVALLVSVLVGFSRVLLGVHYPSDVIAGWCLGLAWAHICWVIHKRLARRFSASDDELD